jgi:hypothetical protein
MRQYAVPAIGSLFNIAQSPRAAFVFFSNLFSNKKDRAAFAGGPSQGGNAPGKGSDSGGVCGHRVSYFANRKIPRIDEAQFFTHVSFLSGDRSYCSRSSQRDTDPLFQKECTGNSNRFRNKATSCLRLRFSSQGGYPEIEYD